MGQRAPVDSAQPPLFPRLTGPSGDLLGVASLAAAAFFLVSGGAILYGGIGYLDAWIYTSYIKGYGALLERFGRTYYSVRVAAIWPEGFAYRLFGDSAYAIIRWIALLACGGGVTALLRPKAGRWIAYSAGIAMIFSTPILLEIQDDYTQEVGIAYALLALALLMARQPLWTLAGGALISLAINAHEGLLYLVLPLLVGCLVATLAVRKGRQTLIRIAYVVIGFFVVQAGLSIAMGLTYGWQRSNYFFQEVAIDFAQQLSAGAASRWSVPWDNDYGRLTTLTILVGGWLLGATVIAAVRKGANTWALAACTAAMGTLIAMILYSHFAKSTGFVGLPYTLVYATTLSTIVAWVALAAAASGKTGRFMAAGAAILAVFVGFLLPSWLPAGRIWEALWWLGIIGAFGSLVAALAPWRHSRRALAAGAAIIAGLLIPVGPLTTGPAARQYYSEVAMASDSDAAKNERGAEVHSLAFQFVDYVDRNVPPDVRFLVYYPGLPELNSVQSTFLWGYSCLDCYKGSPEWPRFPRRLVKVLRSQQVQSLLMIAPGRSEVLSARDAAAQPAVGFTVQTPVTLLRSGNMRMWVTTSYATGTATPPNR